MFLERPWIHSANYLAALERNRMERGARSQHFSDAVYQIKVHGDIYQKSIRSSVARQPRYGIFNLDQRANRKCKREDEKGERVRAVNLAVNHRDDSRRELSAGELYCQQHCRRNHHDERKDGRCYKRHYSSTVVHAHVYCPPEEAFNVRNGANS